MGINANVRQATLIMGHYVHSVMCNVKLVQNHLISVLHVRLILLEMIKV